MSLKKIQTVLMRLMGVGRLDGIASVGTKMFDRDPWACESATDIDGPVPIPHVDLTLGGDVALWLKRKIQRICNRKEDAQSYGKVCLRERIVYAYAGQQPILDDPHRCVVSNGVTLTELPPTMTRKAWKTIA